MEYQEIALSPLLHEHIRRASDQVALLSQDPQRGQAFHQVMVGRFHDGPEQDQLESVAEAVFLLWWKAIGLWYGRVPLTIETQKVALAGGRRYRVDFAIGVAGTCAPAKPLAVEIDGHAFHERTVDQVAYRNRRDRDLEAAGWRVWHFSFEELMAAPAQVVDDVFTEVSRPWAMAQCWAEPAF